MTFKKGDKVRTEDGSAGEILFVDKGGLEAQVALEHLSIKIRTDTLEMFDSAKASASPVSPRGVAVVGARKGRGGSRLKQ